MKLPHEYSMEEICRENARLVRSGDLPFLCSPYITRKKNTIENLQYLIIPRGSKGARVRKWMRQFLENWHYLPSLDVYGRRIYFWWYDTIKENPVAIVIFATPFALNLPDRDKWIGWTDEQRLSRLNKNVCDEVRFLVMPHIRIQNLQSKILAKSCKIVKREWKERYGDRLVLVTCFTNPKLYKAHSYKGAGFKVIGSTKNGLNIMARPVDVKWREILLA